MLKSTLMANMIITDKCTSKDSLIPFKIKEELHG